ncbi:putative Ig domain-containing protein [Spirosoma validum]|uniref:Ig domain-containing protein n=1 Tax=Spirosoma validum TaxID=2771355 RepID=A0A927GDK8_9BACT|nr:putative Ig domain-containing protein [Spirosoma validum]MBD2753907.1 putative Ig domain-containing protein [Spirosoma validum]
MSPLFRIALPGIVALCWLVFSVQAQTGSPVLLGHSPARVTGFTPVVSRTQQIVDSLQRLTQPGYYPALFAAQSQPNSVANARQTADVCNTYLCQSPAPINTAPVATTNANQSAFTGNPFSYTVNAFTDAETPGSLIYTASFSPVNGLSFDPVTRVISGTPTATTPVNVTITATDPGGLSATAGFVIDVRSCSDGPCARPDLTPILYTRPTTVYGTTTITVVVDVVELMGNPTSGLITVRVAKDAKVSLSFDPGATAINGRDVQNSRWGFDADSNPNYYTLTTSSTVAPGDKLSFGFSGTLTSGATTGVLTLSPVIMGGSGGEVRVNNNVDADKIDYFQQ